MAYVRPFDSAEYERRVSDVKRRMDAMGLELLVCQDPANMNWLTGFNGWSFYMPQAVLVHVEEAVPIWFGRAQDAKSAHITTGLPKSNVVAYSEPLVNHPVDHPYDELSDLIRQRGWGTARTGVDFDAPYYTARAHRHLASGLPDASISDSKELVNWARLVKSEAELAYMREAGELTTRVMNRALAKLAPGVRQHEIAADIYYDQITGLDEKYGDYTSLCPLIQVAEGTSTPHLTWTDEPLPDEGLVVMELAAARRHYHAPLVRTAYIGAPPAEVSKLAAAIVEGGDTAIEAARPGATCAEVEAIWQKTINRHGYSKDSRVGYPIGVGFPPDWGERTASLRPGDNTVLQAGMCFHFQSGIWLDDFGAAISESIIVTENGGERLCGVERGLFIVE